MKKGGAPEAQFHFLPDSPGTEPAGIEAIRSKAEKILSRARIGESFDELVSQYSQHQQSKDRGGILDLVNRTSPYPEFAPLFDLESGQVYPQVIAIEGWFCIARVKSKQSLYNLVRRKIALEQQAKALADMRKEAVIVLDRDLFPATEP
ncbi:MAG: peptidylprolyl isomerase [Candidatus Omnitrophica bacterium]|nr:peptidylprolyl isomerase [Candidatus Omnitrophota bacterium]